jgi:DNA-binding FadR family transcriptional regulator
MIQAADENDFERFKTYDKSFHLTLAQESRSGILCVFGAMMNDLFVSYWTSLCVDYEFPIRVHQLIIDAVRAGDSHLAEQYMIEHIEGAKGFLVKICKQIKMME